jgi:iron complex outermembrane receptor protein
MIRKLNITILIVLLTINLHAQDTLNEIQVIGVRTNVKEAVTETKIFCDSLSYKEPYKDIFFTLEKNTPSIYAQSDNGQSNGYSYLRLRGLDQTRINFNLNGIPLNEMEDQGIYFSNMPGFYNYLSQISVQRGVGTSRFGQTSIAGSVNMETKDITKRIIEGNVLAASNLPENTFLNVFYSPGINSKGFSYQLGGTYLKNKGFRDHSGNEGGSIFYGVGLNKKYNIFKLYGFNGLTINNLSFYGVPMDSINKRYTINLNSKDDKDTFNQNFINFNWINTYNKYVKFNTSSYFNNVNGSYNTGGVLFGVNSYQYGVMSNMVYEKDNDILNIGVNTNIYSRQHFGSDYNGIYSISGTKKYTNTGYKKDFISFVRYIESVNNISCFIDLQFRNVWFSTNNSTEIYNWTFINPKVGWKYIDTHSITHFTFGYTKREPTRTDIIQNIIQRNNIQYGNPDNTIFLENNKIKLSPEEVANLEFGNNFKYDWININVNLYGMVIANEFVATGVIDPFSGFMTKKAVERTVRMGFESDGKIRHKNLEVFYTFQYQKSELFSFYQKSNKIPFCPNLISSVGSSYKFVYWLSIGINSQYVSSMYMGDNSNISKEYVTLNGFINVKYSKIDFNFKVNNILNTKYYIPAGVYNESPTYYVGQLRNWMGTISYELHNIKK